MSRVRTFIAIEIPKKVRDRASDAMNGISTATDSIRWVPNENLHLTVKFLGDVEDREIYGICRSVSRAVSKFKPFSVNCVGLGAFPKTERPRVVWMGIENSDQQLERLSVGLDSSMAELGFPREPRRFRPHITLGRLKQGKKAPEELGQQIRKKIDYRAGQIPVTELVVFSSELTSEGPLYTPMGRSTLGCLD